MKILLSERIRYKNLLKNATGADYIIYDKRQYALKIQANSIYGCLGSNFLKYLRFLPGAECTTGIGRNYLTKAIDIIEHHTNFRVIYGDTDSCLIEYKKGFKNKIKDSFSSDQFIEDSKSAAETVTNLLPEGMHLKYENTFSRMLIISKKKYAGILANKSKLYIKGIDIVKKECMYVH